MGKVQFPLVNVRKDVTNKWHMYHYTGDEMEQIQVPFSSNVYGYYTAWLTEVPDPGTDSISTTAPKISGLTEYRGNPINPNTQRIILGPTQFYVNYQTGQMLFHPSQAGNVFKVDYWGRGSLIEAEDINNLHERIIELEKEQDHPEFISFKVNNFPQRYEVGNSFPSTELPMTVTFVWETTFPERVKEKSIKIEDLTNSIVIGTGLDNTGSYEFQYLNSTQFSKKNKIIFKISALSISDDPLEMTYELRWVYRYYYDVSPSKEITSEQVSGFSFSKLFTYTENKNTNITVEYPEANQQYKVIAIPKVYSVETFMDTGTSLQVVFDSPLELEITNQYGLKIPYNVYVTSNAITSKMSLNLKLVEGE